MIKKGHTSPKWVHNTNKRYSAIRVCDGDHRPVERSSRRKCDDMRGFSARPLTTKVTECYAGGVTAVLSTDSDLQVRAGLTTALDGHVNQEPHSS